MLASGFPVGGIKPRGSDVPFGARYFSGVPLIEPQFEWGARAPGARAVNLPGPLAKYGRAEVIAA